MILPIAPSRPLVFATLTGSNEILSSGGFSDIKPEGVQLLLETVEEQSEIDKKRAEQSLEKAQKQISDRSVDLDRAQRSIQKAKNRLKILNK